MKQSIVADQSLALPKGKLAAQLAHVPWVRLSLLGRPRPPGYGTILGW